MNKLRRWLFGKEFEALRQQNLELSRRILQAAGYRPEVIDHIQKTPGIDAGRLALKQPSGARKFRSWSTWARHKERQADERYSETLTAALKQLARSEAKK